MKVGFLDIVHDVLKEGLQSKGFECIDLTEVSKENILSDLASYDGIVVRSRFPIDEVFLSKAENLKFIARSGAGMENIDIDYCENNNIKLFNAPEGNRNAVGEHALGMILSLFNNLNKGDKEVRSGLWDREGNRGVELDGKTIGLIGFGNNGAAFAKKLRGFDVEVLAYDKYKSGYGNEFVKEVSLETLKEKAEVLSLHIPQNEETKWMINHSFINEMKNSFYLINLSRGQIVVTEDLKAGLESDRVLGACLDVLEYEKSSFEDMFDDKNIPEAFKYLIDSDKTILSPHVGGWTNESYYLLSKVLLDKIITSFDC